MIVKDYNKKYNGLIDILKFIFSGLIVFSHGIFWQMMEKNLFLAMN